MGRSATLEPTVAVVPEDVCASPFAGITLDQARLMNSALVGLPVEVYGGKNYGRAGPVIGVYIFGGMVLPGMMRLDPLQANGDLILRHAKRVADCWVVKPGISRVLSAVLVRRFDVLAIEPQYRICETCGKPMPLTEKVFDVAGLGNAKLPDGDFEWSQRFECRDCWEGCW